ncbi:hypothetical protein A6V39_04340 [Candidatus Mycoplasma haematobovis]|uniref:Uncharacterized protein n=1 Tax=Candidatus Mycoplasma haematobovis TaxID=432608 RepID=A0A1A9QDU8_9MOLU|nr:hypothetical protein [Candidatus Mycoplasma haematobovis]OAL10115.1 hypothetical protein A6V39_04340 [Candidatus Mycoplasma haematobovis]
MCCKLFKSQKSTTVSQDLFAKGLNLISSFLSSDLATQWQEEFESYEENIKKAIGVIEVIDKKEERNYNDNEFKI